MGEYKFYTYQKPWTFHQIPMIYRGVLVQKLLGQWEIHEELGDFFPVKKGQRPSSTLASIWQHRISERLSALPSWAAHSATAWTESFVSGIEVPNSHCLGDEWLINRCYRWYSSSIFTKRASVWHQWCVSRSEKLWVAEVFPVFPWFSDGIDVKLVSLMAYFDVIFSDGNVSKTTGADIGQLWAHDPLF